MLLKLDVATKLFLIIVNDMFRMLFDDDMPTLSLSTLVHVRESTVHEKLVEKSVELSDAHAIHAIYQPWESVKLRLYAQFTEYLCFFGDMGMLSWQGYIDVSPANESSRPVLTRIISEYILSDANQTATLSIRRVEISEELFPT